MGSQGPGAISICRHCPVALETHLWCGTSALVTTVTQQWSKELGPPNSNLHP